MPIDYKEFGKRMFYGETATTPEPKPEPVGTLRNVWDRYSAGTNATIVSPLAGLTEGVANAVGLGGVANVARAAKENAEAYSADVEARNPKATFSEAHTLGDYGAAARDSILENAPQLLVGGLAARGGAAVAGGLARAVKGADIAVNTLNKAKVVGALGAGSAQNIATESGIIYNDQPENRKDLGRAFLYGVPAGLVETGAATVALGTSGLGKYITDTAKDAALPALARGTLRDVTKAGIKTVGLGSLAEGTEEIIQAPLEHKGAFRNLTDGNGNLTPELKRDMYEGFMGGASVGGFFSGAGHTHSTLRNKAAINALASGKTDPAIREQLAANVSIGLNDELRPVWDSYAREAIANGQDMPQAESFMREIVMPENQQAGTTPPTDDDIADDDITDDTMPEPIGTPPVTPASTSTPPVNTLGNTPAAPVTPAEAAQEAKRTGQGTLGAALAAGEAATRQQAETVGNPYASFAKMWTQSDVMPQGTALPADREVEAEQLSQAAQWAQERMKNPLISTFERQSLGMMAKNPDMHKVDLLRRWRKDTLQATQQPSVTQINNATAQPDSFTPDTIQQTGQPLPVEQVNNTPVQPADTSAVTKKQKDRTVKPSQDDIVTAIAKLGGLNREQAVSQWGNNIKDAIKDLNLHATTRSGGGVGWLYAIHKQGRNLDDMREVLEEHGYLQPNSTIEDMYSKIDSHLGGRPQYSNQYEGQFEEPDYSQPPDGYESLPDTASSSAGNNNRNIPSVKKEAKKPYTETARQAKQLPGLMSSDIAKFDDVKLDSARQDYLEAANIAFDSGKPVPSHVLSALKKINLEITKREVSRADSVESHLQHPTATTPEKQISQLGDAGHAPDIATADSQQSGVSAVPPVTFAGQDVASIQSPNGGNVTHHFTSGTEQGGSEYILTSDGHVRRNKGDHKNTGGTDSGLKEWNSNVLFLEDGVPSNAPHAFNTTAHTAMSKLFGNFGKNNVHIQFDGRTANALVYDGSQWRQATWGDAFQKSAKQLGIDAVPLNAMASDKPAVGLHVLDYSVNTNGGVIAIHNGSPVTSVTPVNQQQQPTAIPEVQAASSKQTFTKQSPVAPPDNPAFLKPTESKQNKDGSYTITQPKAETVSKEDIPAILQTISEAYDNGHAMEDYALENFGKVDGRVYVIDADSMTPLDSPDIVHENKAALLTAAEKSLRGGTTEKAASSNQTLSEESKPLQPDKQKQPWSDSQQQAQPNFIKLKQQAKAAGLDISPKQKDGSYNVLKNGNIVATVKSLAEVQQYLQKPADVTVTPQQQAQKPDATSSESGTIEETKGGVDNATDSVSVRKLQTPEPESLGRVREILHGSEQDDGRNYESILERQEKRLREWAGRTGRLVDHQQFSDLWAKQTDEAGKAIKGNEQQVLLSEPEGIVYKRKLLWEGETWLDYINRLIAHRNLFPGTMYSFHGFSVVPTAKGNIFMALVTQPYSKRLRDATESEISAYMEGKGFRSYSDEAFDKAGATAFKYRKWKNSKGVVVSDLGDNNVWVDTNGKVVVIDPTIDVPKSSAAQSAPKAADKGKGDSNVRETSGERTRSGGQAATLQTGEDTAASGNAAAGNVARKQSEEVQGSVQSGNDTANADGTGTTVRGSTRDAGSSSVEQVSGSARDNADVRHPSHTTGSSRNFTITNELDFAGQGAKTKYRNNVAAIKLLRTLEAENRPATPEEQAVLAKYVGWGGMPQAFDKDKSDWASEYKELKELLTPEQYETAASSTRNAHYTSASVVKAVWQAVQHLGFKHGSVLEPSVGTGNFFGLMPREARSQSKMTGVEFDHTTGSIAKHLYPQARIHAPLGFQEIQLVPESFDLAIGNPPFGSESIYDKNNTDISKFKIHGFFFAKSLDAVRPGGVLAMVVSKGLLDANDATAQKTREYLASRAKLLGAVRLPDSAFKENAGTDVTTDIIFLQKLQPGESGNTETWNSIGVVKDRETGGDIRINKYFLDNPDMMLGEMTLKGKMYRGGSETLTAREGDNLQELLNKAILRLPANIITTGNALPTTKNLKEQTGLAGIHEVRPYNFFVSNGAVYQRMPDENGEAVSVQVELEGAKLERVLKIIEIREVLRKQLVMEAGDVVNEKNIEANRTRLNQLYDAFTKKYGYLNDTYNNQLFKNDADSSLVRSLEKDYDKGVSKEKAKKEGVEPRKTSAGKADIFFRRVLVPVRPVTRVHSAIDALLASLNEKGSIDFNYISSIYDKNTEDVITELGDAIYDDPSEGWVTADAYLSGNVKAKLAEALIAARGNQSYTRNVKALEKVQPADVPASDIYVAPHSYWVPADIFRQFAQDVLSGSMVGEYSKATARWSVEFSSHDTTINTAKYGTTRMPATKIMATLMSNKQIAVYDTVEDENGKELRLLNVTETAAAQGKADELVEAFNEWIWKDSERRQRLVRLYNDNFNTIVERKFDGSMLTLPGSAATFVLRPHQKNAVARTLQTGVVLYDHVVGAGKTALMAASAMEMRRLGLARKPMIVVPNHLVEQWAREFNQQYPQAKLLVATKKDFKKENRKLLFAKIATGDWDAVVGAHSSFKFIPVPRDMEQEILDEQKREIIAAIQEAKQDAGKRFSVKDLERAKERIETKLQRLADMPKDDMLNFAELGVDALFVDEAHEFKNLFYTTSMQNVAGLGNQEGSSRAFDMFIKTQYLMRRNGGKGVFFATGTPVSNSLAEVFHMQRFLQYNELKSRGLHNFDAWASAFGLATSDWEQDASGRYKQKTRFRKLVNLPELKQLWNTVTDTVVNSDLINDAAAQGKRFPLPKVEGGKPTNIIVERSPEQAKYIGIPREAKDEDGNIIINQETGQPVLLYDSGTVVYRMENWRQAVEDGNTREIPLVITGDARKAGLDFRLIDENAPDFAGSKINTAVNEIFNIWQGNDYRKGTQLVFIDLSTPKSHKGKATENLAAAIPTYFVRSGTDITHVQGKPVVLQAMPDAEFFHYRKAKNEVVVVEKQSGLHIAVGETIKGAIEKAESRLQSVGVESTREAIAARAIPQEMVDDYISAWEDAKTAKDEPSDNTKEDDDAEPEQEISFDELLADSGKSNFSAYDDIKAKLIAMGIPAEQIAFIHDANTDAQKQDLFARMNKGLVRVLLGSTAKMGAGTNVQKKLVALHHLDAPWKPSDLAQREGRIIRQGNEFYNADPDGFVVKIRRYATKQTYDSRMWEIIETKAKAIELFKTGGKDVREVEDISSESANAAEIKASAAGNPLMLEDLQLKNEIKKLEAMEKSFKRSKFDLEDLVRSVEGKTARPYKRLAFLESLTTSAQPKDKDKIGLKLGKVVYNNKDSFKPEAMFKVLQQAFTEAIRDGRDVNVGNYRGLSISVEYDGFRQTVLNISLRDNNGNRVGSTEYTYDDKFSAGGFVTRLDNVIDSLSRDIVAAKQSISRLESNAASAKEQLAAPFKHAATLESLRGKHRKVLDALRKGKQSVEEDTAEAMQQYSTASTPEKTGLNVSEIQHLADAGKMITTLQSVSDAPAHIQEQMKNDGVVAAKGLYDPATNTVYLFADHIESAKEAATTVLAHELTHKGLAALGAEGKQLLGSIIIGNGKAINAIIAEAKAQGRTMSRAEAANEFLAREGETKLNPKLWQRILNFIKDGALRLFGMKASDKDVRDALARVREGLKGKTAGNSKSKLQYLTAWHGSPHDHNKFTTEKIGTGEGAQAYGYGLYFADNREIAEWYRDKLGSYKEVTYKNQDVDGAENMSYRELFNAVREKLKEEYGDFKDIDSVAQQMIEDDTDVTVQYQTGEKGRLYQVELAPEPDEYLLWDKPLSEQSEKVKAALESVFGDIDVLKSRRFELSAQASKMDGSSVNDPLGMFGVADEGLQSVYAEISDLNKRIDAAKRVQSALKDVQGETLSGAGIQMNKFYKGLERNLGSDKAASEYLHSLGIRGIKYLDGNSRSDGEGSYNYVIFNDADVSIAEKFSLKEQTRLASSVAQAKAELKRLGLDNAAVLQFMDSIANGRAEGSQIGNVIKIAMDAKDPVGVLHHEVMHLLRSFGAFSDKEWNALSFAATQWAFTHPDKDALARRYAEYKKAGMSKETINEEKIADMFRGFAAHKKVSKPSLVADMIERVKQFFRALQNAFRGNGFVDAQAVMQAVYAGKKGQREGLGGRTAEALSDRMRSFLYGYNGDRRTFDERVQIPSDYRNYLDRKSGTATDILRQYGLPVTAEEAEQIRASGDGKYLRVATAGGDVAPIELKYPYRYRPTYSASLKKWFVSGSIPSMFDLNKFEAAGFSERLQNAYMQSESTPYYSLTEQQQYEKEYAEVEARYFNADGTPKAGAMLAPNGKKSNLNKRQWIQVRTPSFKAWFQDSKVVDANGEPLVVYHGTDADFAKFSKKHGGRNTLARDAKNVFFFTSSPDVADDFAGYQYYTPDGITIDKAYAAGANLIPVFLSVKNADIWDMGGGSYEENWLNSVIKDARKDKKDSVIFTHMRDGSVSTVGQWKKSHIVAVFSPTQIKSATGNSGAFDSSNPDIRYSFASDAIDYGRQAINNTSAEDVINSLKKALNPFDFSRSSRWFNRVMPEQVKDAMTAIFRTPEGMAERDADIREFVATSREREAQRQNILLRFQGWDDEKGESSTFVQRMKDNFASWSDADASTEWGRLVGSIQKLNKDQQNAVDVLLSQGDVRGLLFESLAHAQQFYHVKKANPDKAAFKAYQDVRAYIDGHMADTMEDLYRETGLAAGISKQEVEKHIKDYRAELKKRPGWMPRNHGEGQHQANVYHVIESLDFEISEDSGVTSAHLPYYAGIEATKKLQAAVKELQSEYSDDAIEMDIDGNGRMTVSGESHVVEQFLEKAGKVVDEVHQDKADALAKLKQELADAQADPSSTKAKIRELESRIAKHGDGKIRVKVYMRLFNSENAAKKQRDLLNKNMAAEMPENYRRGRKYEIKYAYADKLSEDTYGDITSGFAMEQAQLKAMERAVNAGDMSETEAAELRNAIMQRSAEVLLARGSGRHQIGRAPYLIEGYDTTDTVQMYDDYMTSTAGMLSKAAYAKEQFDNFRYAPNRVKGWAEGYIRDTLRNMGVADRISGNARMVASFWFMGMKMSSVFVNGTQTWTLGVAELGRRTKQNSVAAIGKAQKDIISSNLNDKEKFLLNSALMKQQELATAVHEATGATMGETGKLSRMAHKITNKSLFFFQEMEMLNRKTMLLAAYRAGLADGMNEADATQFAVDVNRTVNFEMSRGNLPKWAMNPTGRTLFALQSFVWNSWNWIYNRASSGEKKDMVALLKYGALISLFGGVSALAGGDEADKLYRRLYGRSIKLDLKNFTQKHLKDYGTPGQMLHDFIWHGGAGLLGVNISNAMRLNIPLSGILTGALSAGEAASGVFGGLANKAAMAGSALSKGNIYRAVESAAPEAISGTMRAYRQYSGGVTTISGKPVFDEQGNRLSYTGMDAVKRGLGFQPHDKSLQAELSRTQDALAKFWNGERSDALAEIRAAANGAEIIKIMTDFNRRLSASQATGVVSKIKLDSVRRARNSKADKRDLKFQEKNAK